MGVSSAAGSSPRQKGWRGGGGAVQAAPQHPPPCPPSFPRSAVGPGASPSFPRSAVGPGAWGMICSPLPLITRRARPAHSRLTHRVNSVEAGSMTRPQNIQTTGKPAPHWRGGRVGHRAPPPHRTLTALPRPVKRLEADVRCVLGVSSPAWSCLGPWRHQRLVAYGVDQCSVGVPTSTKQPR